jgi:O-antigen/teichoic acid export membrane protein
MASILPSPPEPDSPVAPHPVGNQWSQRFFFGVLWSWAGVAATFFTGFFLSPYIIRQLGDSRYGMWALAFAFIDYFVLFDFGFKSAAVNFLSRAKAEGDEQQINEIVNTSLFYFLGIAGFLLGLTYAISGSLHLWFQITPEYRREFLILIRIIAIGWATAIALNIFNAGMEAFQQFKAQNSISVLVLILRSGGCAIAVYLGYGLIVMGVIVLIGQVITYALMFRSFRHTFPALRISPDLIRIAIWKRMARYGSHAFVAYLGNMLLGQGPPILIGRFRVESYVGYYALPSRLLQNVADLVTRIGYVTMPNAAELAERGQYAKIVQLGTYLNRYCFALFMPVGLFLLVFGRELIQVWVGVGFADQSAPLLPAFVLMTMLAVAGQFNSSVILFGLAKHDTYAKALLAEAVLSLIVMALVLPVYGLVGASWVAAAFAIINRGLVTPYLLSRTLQFSLLSYLRGIHLVPALLAVPVLGYAYWIKSQWLAGRNWFELLTILGLIALPYYGACYFAIMEGEHRALLKEWIRALTVSRLAPSGEPPQP